MYMYHCTASWCTSTNVCTCHKINIEFVVFKKLLSCPNPYCTQLSNCIQLNLGDLADVYTFYTIKQLSIEPCPPYQSYTHPWCRNYSRAGLISFSLSQIMREQFKDEKYSFKEIQYAMKVQQNFRKMQMVVRVLIWCTSTAFPIPFPLAQIHKNSSQNYSIYAIVQGATMR